MKDLPMAVPVVVRSSNRKISRRHLADRTKGRPARAARLFFLIQSIISLICSVAAAFIVS